MSDIATNLVSESLTSDDRNILSDLLVQLEVHGELRVVSLDDVSGRSLDSLGSNSSHLVKEYLNQHNYRQTNRETTLPSIRESGRTCFNDNKPTIQATTGWNSDFFPLIEQDKKKFRMESVVGISERLSSGDRFPSVIKHMYVFAAFSDIEC